MSNIKIGNDCEQNVVNVLRECGYWVYRTPRGNSGNQPVDIIAARGDMLYTSFYLIDAKHVRNEEISFPFDRIEVNQITTMLYASTYAQLNVNNMGFAIIFDRTGDIYWFPYKQYCKLFNQGRKSVKLAELELLKEIVK